MRQQKQASGSQSENIKQYLMQACEPAVLSMIETLVNQQIQEKIQRYQSMVVVEGQQVAAHAQDIPECFPKLSTKKYVEVTTGEAMFVKENGEVFY